MTCATVDVERVPQLLPTKFPSTDGLNVWMVSPIGSPSSECADPQSSRSTVEVRAILPHAAVFIAI